MKEVKDLQPSELKQIFCAAMGWHLHTFNKDFDQYYDSIRVFRNSQGWTMRGGLGTQIELNDSLKIRCGGYKVKSFGGTAFDFIAVYNTFNKLGLIPKEQYRTHVG